MDINPLLANIGFSAISTAINSTLQSFAPTGEKDIFKHIYETYEKNALTFFGAGDPRDPNYAWQQAAYIAQIQDFTEIIRGKGLETALNTYATGFFNSTAVNAIVSTGMTVGEYFKEKLEAGEFAVKTKDGKQYAEVAIEDAQHNSAGEAYFGWLEETQGWDDFMGSTETDENGIDMYKWGDLYKDVNDDVGYYGYAELYNQWGDLGVFQKIENGNQTYFETRDNEGNLVLMGIPIEEDGYNIYNSNGEYAQIVIKDSIGNVGITIKDGLSANTARSIITYGDVAELLDMETTQEHDQFLGFSLGEIDSGNNLTLEFEQGAVGTTTSFFERAGNYFVDSVVELKDICKSILDQPQMKTTEGAMDVIDGLGEYALGAALITGGAAGEVPSMGTSTSLIVAGWALIAKATIDVSSGVALLNESFSNDYSEEIDMLNSAVGDTGSQLYSISDGFYSTYDATQTYHSLNLFGLGSAIIDAMRLYIGTVESFTGR